MSSAIFFFLFIPLLAFILLAINLIFAPHNPYMEKNSVFECGFSSFLGQNRTQFSISFFIFALLFLLFDLEILLVYPYLVSGYTNGVYGLVVILMFLLALTLGFAFELGKKALSIDSRQMSNVSTNKKSNGIHKVNAKLGPFPFLNVAKRHYSSFDISAQFLVKSIDYILYSLSKQIMLVLSSFLLLSLFLYLVLYIFGLTSCMLYFYYILLFLFFSIDYALDFYNYTKTRACVSAETNIKPYSNNEFIISTGEFLSVFRRRAMIGFSIIFSPVMYLYNPVKKKIKNVIIDLLTATPHYKALMSINNVKDFFCLLDTFSLDAHHFIIRNVLNIICHLLLFMCGVYMGFIPLSLFLLNTYVIFLSFSIVYICKYRSFFKNDIVFLICLSVLLVLLGMVFYCIYLYTLGLFTLLIKDSNNKSPSGPSGKQGGPEKGGGPGGPNGPDGYNPSSANPSKRKRRKDDPEVETQTKRQRVETQNPDSESTGPGGAGKPTWDSSFVMNWFFSKKRENETYTTSVTEYDNEGWHLGHTPQEVKDKQELLLRNKNINIYKTGEDTDYDKTSTDRRYYGNEWEMKYNLDVHGNIIDYSWIKVGNPATQPLCPPSSPAKPEGIEVTVGLSVRETQRRQGLENARNYNTEHRKTEMGKQSKRNSWERQRERDKENNKKNNVKERERKRK